MDQVIEILEERLKEAKNIVSRQDMFMIQASESVRTNGIDYYTKLLPQLERAIGDLKKSDQNNEIRVVLNNLGIEVHKATGESSILKLLNDLVIFARNNPIKFKTGLSMMKK